MGNFDKEKGQIIADPTDALKSPESKLSFITRNPIEIDLSQPDQADKGAMERVTGLSESKLIAEFETPKGRIGVVHTEVPEYPVLITLIGDGVKGRVNLAPGETLDLSEKEDAGNCLVTFTEKGRLFVHAGNPNPDYKVTTQQTELGRVDETSRYYHDDPEFDDPE